MPIHTYIHTYIHTDSQTDRQTDKQAQPVYIHTYVHTYIHTDRQTDRQAGRQTDRQTDRTHRPPPPRHVSKFEHGPSGEPRGPTTTATADLERKRSRKAVGHLIIHTMPCLIGVLLSLRDNSDPQLTTPSGGMLHTRSK